jgi:hypothetical protein
VVESDVFVVWQKYICAPLYVALYIPSSLLVQNIPSALKLPAVEPSSLADTRTWYLVLDCQYPHQGKPAEEFPAPPIPT